MTDESPVSRVLRTLDLTSADAAMLADVSPASISGTRAGGKIPLGLRIALDRAGVDVCALEAEQSAYRQRRASEINEKLVTRCAAAGCNK